MKFLLLSFVVWANVIVCTLAAQKNYRLTESISNCDQEDPNISECVLKAIQDYFPRFHDGIEEFGIPPLDPYYVSKQKLSFKVLDAIEGFFIFKSVKVSGVSATKFHKVLVKITDEGGSAEASLTVPSALVEGKYKARIKINDFKMTSKGYFNITATDVKVNLTTSGKFRTINGVKHILMDNFDIKDFVGDFKIYASSLLPDPEQNNALLEITNRYMPEVLRIGIPLTRDQWSPVVIQSVNDFLSVVPFDRMISRRIYE